MSGCKIGSQMLFRHSCPVALRIHFASRHAVMFDRACVCLTSAGDQCCVPGSILLSEVLVTAQLAEVDQVLFVKPGYGMRLGCHLINLKIHRIIMSSQHSDSKYDRINESRSGQLLLTPSAATGATIGHSTTDDELSQTNKSPVPKHLYRSTTISPEHCYLPPNEYTNRRLETIEPNDDPVKLQ